LRRRLLLLSPRDPARAEVVARDRSVWRFGLDNLSRASWIDPAEISKRRMGERSATHRFGDVKSDG
jgi:hypothetical protein